MLSRLVASGELERVARGLYRLPQHPQTEHHSRPITAIFRGPHARGIQLGEHAVRTNAIGAIGGGVPMSHQYSYLLLRYVHDIVSGEQLNVGVVVYSRSANYLGSMCRTTHTRLARAFVGFQEDAFGETMRSIQCATERLAERVSCVEGRRGLGDSIMDLVTQVLPSDDSSLQWSAPGCGVSTDLQETLEHLYERMVTRYDGHDAQER